MSDVITIGIAGGTGSGKTTITRRILDEFGGDVSVLYHDNYYKRHDDIPFAERKKLNYDHPNAFDTPLLVQHLEGILIFAEPALRERLDIKIFVDTDADVRILRRIVRVVRDRGRDLESIVTQYLTTVKPMHEMFVEPSKRYADIIIPEGGHNQVALDFVMERIRAYVKERD